MMRYRLIPAVLLALTGVYGCGSSPTGGNDTVPETDDDVSAGDGDELPGDLDADGTDEGADGADDAAGADDADAGADGADSDADEVGADAAGDGGLLDCGSVVCDLGCSVYVDAGAAAAGSGAAPEDALTDVQAGIEAARVLAGECCRCTVRVAEGTYYLYESHPTDTLRLRERVDVEGGYATGFVQSRDPEAYTTILDGHAAAGSTEQVFHVVTGANDALLDGFVVTGGKAVEDDAVSNPHNYGGGMANLGVSPVVANCVFFENHAVFGAGMYNRDSEATIRGCQFDGNQATQSGGGMDNRHSAVTVHGTVFRANTAARGAGVYNGAGSQAKIGSTAFFGNVATGSGGAVLNSSSAPALVNCTFTSNHAASGAAVRNESDADATVANSVLWGDTPDEVSNDAGSAPAVLFSDVQGGCTVASGCTADETGNLVVDPIFVVAAGNPRIWLDSPVVDKGDNLLAAALLEDLEGEPRVVDGDADTIATVDMGADEMSWASEDFRVIYVDHAARGRYDGSSWQDAFVDLQEALAVATPYTQIWVAHGTYTPSDLGDRNAFFALKPSTVVFGGFDPDGSAETFESRDPEGHETILSGDINHNDDPDNATTTNDNSETIVKSANLATLDGFTITGGRATSSVGPALTASGNHLFLVRNCRITKNHGLGAGALYMEEGAITRVVRCTFDDNRGDQTAAVYAYRPAYEAAFVDSVFSNNWGGEMGGALAIEGVSSPSISGCEFLGNRAGQLTGYGGGAIYLSHASPRISDCLFTGNTAGNGGAMLLRAGAAPEIRDCVFEDNSASSGYLSSACSDNAVVTAGCGGAVFNHASTLRIQDSVFRRNSASVTGNAPCNNSNTYYGVGGAIFNTANDLSLGTPPALAYLKRLTFEDNSATITGQGKLAGAGGAIGSYYTRLWVVSSTFSGNSATRTGAPAFQHDDGSGGAVWGHILPGSTNPSAHGAAFANCVFAGNSANGGMGGGMYIVSATSMWVFNSTFAGNSASGWLHGGGAFVSYGEYQVIGSIFWGNTGGTADYAQITGGVGGCNSMQRVVTNATTIQDGCPGEGTANACNCTTTSAADPLIDPTGYALQTGSPAIDAGTPTAAAPAGEPADWTDLDEDGNTAEPVPLDLAGNSRFVDFTAGGGVIDRGAYEHP